MWRGGKSFCSSGEINESKAGRRAKRCRSSVKHETKDSLNELKSNEMWPPGAAAAKWGGTGGGCLMTATEKGGAE